MDSIPKGTPVIFQNTRGEWENAIAHRMLEIGSRNLVTLKSRPYGNPYAIRVVGVDLVVWLAPSEEGKAWFRYATDQVFPDAIGSDPDGRYTFVGDRSLWNNLQLPLEAERAIVESIITQAKKVKYYQYCFEVTSQLLKSLEEHG